MKSIDFEGSNKKIAEHQEEFQTIHAFQHKRRPEFYSCFELTEEEAEEVARTKQIWYMQLVGGARMQPMNLFAFRPTLAEMSPEPVEDVYFVLDFETGGFDKLKHALCEFGLTVVEDGNFVETNDPNHTLVKPYYRNEEEGALMEYHPKAMAVNGLNVEELMSKGHDIKNPFLFIIAAAKHYDCDTLVCHGKSFDEAWLIYYLEKFEMTNPFKNVVCTRGFAQRLIKEGLIDCESSSLTALCEHFGINRLVAHRAIDDSKATHELFEILKQVEAGTYTYPPKEVTDEEFENIDEGTAEIEVP